jgi:hypothetical protein
MPAHKQIDNTQFVKQKSKIFTSKELLHQTIIFLWDYSPFTIDTIIIFMPQLAPYTFINIK